MDRSQRRKQYLEIYRRQLGRELDAMGYGRAQQDVRNVERQDRNGLSSTDLPILKSEARLDAGATPTVSSL